VFSNEPKMNIVDCPQAQKEGGAFFRLKLHSLEEKKISYKVFCGNTRYCRRQSWKAFSGLSIRAEMVRGGRPLLREKLAKTDPPLQDAISNQYSLVAPHAITPTEKSSINMNRKSTTSFPMSLRW